LWGFYGRNPRGELCHDGIVPTAFLCPRLALGVQLLPEVAYLVLQGLDKLGLAAWYAGVGRLVRLRRTTAQQYEHGPALFYGGQCASLYAAADRALGYAESSGRLGDG